MVHYILYVFFFITGMKHAEWCWDKYRKIRLWVKNKIAHRNELNFIAAIES